MVDIFTATECAFLATNISRPFRTIEVVADAPVQNAMTAEVPPSCGSFTFPADSLFADRFIIWRASGSKLHLEERSICRTVRRGCIVLNFCRAPIVPGTHFTYINHTLYLIVPTQSSVHRFFARVAFEPSDIDGEMVEATLTQFVDFIANREGFAHSEAHDRHILAFNKGVPFRAAVAVRPGEHRVALAVGDGQLVVVTFPQASNERSEEVVVSDGSFLQRMISSAPTGGVLDVAATELPRPRSNLPGTTDYTAFYTLHRDGTIRVINGESHQTVVSQSLLDHILDLTSVSEIHDASLRWIMSEGCEFVLVAVTTERQIHFLLLRDIERVLYKVAEVKASKSSRVLDFNLHPLPGMEGSVKRLWMCTGKAHRPTEYSLEYIDIPMPGTHNARQMANFSYLRCWQQVRPVDGDEDEMIHGEDEDAPADPANTQQSIIPSDLLRRSIFNVEIRTFDVVARAVKVTCGTDDLRCNTDDWAGLISFVDSFIKGPGLQRVTGEMAGRQDAGEQRVEAERRFLRALLSSCLQIERSMYKAMGLLLMFIRGTTMVGVIQESRLTLVLDSCKPLSANLTRSQKESLLEALDDARDEDDEMFDDDDINSPRRGMGKGYSFSTIEDEEEGETLMSAVECFIKRAMVVGDERELPDERIGSYEGSGDDEQSSVDVGDEAAPSSDSIMSHSSDEGDELERHCYGGNFTSGLVSALLRLRVDHSIELSTGILKAAQRKHPYLEIYCKRLRSIRSSLKVLQSQLNLCLERGPGGFESLGWWLFSPARLRLMRVDGGEAFGQIGDEPPKFCEYVERSVLASLFSIYPNGDTQTLPKILVMSEKFEILKAICSLPWEVPAHLQSVASFYKAVAFSGTGMPRKALTMFMEAARGMRTGDDALRRALVPIRCVREKRGLYPQSRLQPEPEELSIGDYFVKAIMILNEHAHQQEVIEMSREAMSKLPEGEHKSSINATLFKRQVDGEQWKEALATIQSTTDASLRRTFVHEVLSRLLAVGDWQTIIRSQFGPMTTTVETILLNEARATDAGVQPHPFQLISAFLVAQNNYALAATYQYELAFYLSQTIQTKEILRRRRDALTAAVNLLDLLPAHKRFISYPERVRFSSGERQVTKILTVEGMTREWLMTRGRCALLEVDGYMTVPPDQTPALIAALAKNYLFDLAIELARHLDEDPSPILRQATVAALKLDADPLVVVPEWVANNKKHAIASIKHEHWSVVRGLLSMATLRWPADSRPLTAVASAFLAYSVPIPCWLHDILMEKNSSGYARLLLDYDGVGEALGVVASAYSSATAAVTSVNARVVVPALVAEEALRLAAYSSDPHVTKLRESCVETIGKFTTRARNFAMASRL